MDEQEREEFAFIKEKIKERPVNKKRLFRQGCYTVGFAVVFGIVACLVFTIMRPIMENWLYPKENPIITIPEDEWETEQTDMAFLEETEELENTTEDVDVATEVPETEMAQSTVTETIIKQELSLYDYQQLQNKIYSIGKDANCSVVTVTGVVSDTDWFNNSYESTGLASGIIIGDNGNELLILTEHKVVKTAEEIHVTFIDDSTVPAFLKKYDGNTGIAILAVDLNSVKDSTKERISYAVLGNSLRTVQGNIAIAIGSPLGTNYSIGTGNITSINNVIQTIDATYTVFTTDIVGSSNSNGVLLNLNGEVVGLVRQDYSSDGADNTLTAISISELKEVIEMLSNDKDIPYLGLKVVAVTDKIAAEYDIPKGIYIKEVMFDSPAWEAGLQSGDVIVKMDGEEIRSEESYKVKVLALEQEQVVEVVVNRQGMNEYIEMTCNVTAGCLK